MRVLKTSSYKKQADIDRYPDRPILQEGKDRSGVYYVEIIRGEQEVSLRVQYDYEAGDPATGFAAGVEVYDVVEANTGQPIALTADEMNYVKSRIQKELEGESEVEFDDYGEPW